MSPAIVAIVLFAALMNVTWHVVVKTAGDPLLMTTRAMGGSIVVVTPFVAAAWYLAGQPGMTVEGWLLAVVSGVIELGYFVTLSAAYRRGDLSTVYPIARGTAALGAVLVGIVLLGERPDAVALVGIALLLVGGWVVRRPAMAARSSAVGWALLTGLTITAYSAVDRLGAREGPPWLYGWTMFAIGAALLAGWVVIDARTDFTSRIARRALAGGGLAARLASGPAASPAGRGPVAVQATTVGDPVETGIPRTDTRAGDGAAALGTGAQDVSAPWGRAIVAGVLILVAYFLVLYAYSVAPLSIVSPLRESAVVLATAWGVFGLGEREGAAQRIGGAVIIALGGILVAVG
jgi:drug/metabolite transporter (DMT)-like permease